MSGDPVIVPSPVRDSIEMIRQSGLTNMFDRPAVIRIATEWGLHGTAAWISTHRTEYAEGIFRGFADEEHG